MLNDYAQLDRRVLEGRQTARPTLYPVILFLGRPLGENSFTVKQLMQKEVLGYGQISDTVPDDLEQAWSKGNSRTVGRALLRRVHRRIGEEGLYLERTGHTGGVAIWQVKTG